MLVIDGLASWLKVRNELACMWNFETKAVLGYIVTVCDNLPQGFRSSTGPFDCRVLRSCLVPQCSYPPYWPRHQRRLVNCDWITASYTSGQPSTPRRHPTCWASSQRRHTMSRTRCHVAWTPAPLSAHPYIRCSCKAPQIETHICTRRTTTHQFFWRQHRCGAVGGQSHKTPHFNSRHRYTLPPEWPSQEEPGSGITASAPVSDVSAPACTSSCLLPVQMWYGLLCDLWVWHRTNRRPRRPTLSNSSTSPRTARPDGSGQCDNRMASQHLPRYLGGLALVKRRTRSNERRWQTH